MLEIPASSEDTNFVDSVAFSAWAFEEFAEIADRAFSLRLDTYATDWRATGGCPTGATRVLVSVGGGIVFLIRFNVIAAPARKSVWYS